MKRKIISIVLALAVAFSCLALFSACGGGPKVLDETSWQEMFDDVNFFLRNKRSDGHLRVTANSYNIKGEEYGKNLTYKGNTYDYYTIVDREVVAIEAEDYVDYITVFAPFFTFMHDNFSNFTMSNFIDDENTQVFVYNDVLPDDARTAILEMMKATCRNQAEADAFEYNYHSILLVSNYDNFRGIYFMDGECEYSHDAIYESENAVAVIGSVGDCEDHQVIKEMEYEEEMHAYYVKLENAFKPVSDFENGGVNFKVIGGQGADYMEFYFNANGMRFYTPNAGTQYVDGIYYNDNGTYKYYKKTSSGTWLVEEVTEDRYENTIEQMYELYCGGKWFDEIERLFDMDTTKNEWKVSDEFTGSVSPYSLRYFDIKINTDGNFNILSGSWKLEMSLPEAYGGAKVTYSYNMTVGAGAFTVPSV